MSKVYTTEVKAVILSALESAPNYEAQTAQLSQIAANLGVSLKSIIAAVSRDGNLRPYYRMKPKLKKRKTETAV